MSTAVVPYVYSNRFKYASRIGKFAWENRADIRKAAQKIMRVAKRRRFESKRRKVVNESFSPKNIGKPIGTSDCKTWESHNIVATDGNTRQLYGVNMMKIPPGTSESYRERQIINCSGIRICTEFQNAKSASPEETLYLNVAVISPKESVCSDFPLEDKFFGGQGGLPNERTRDFDTTLTSNEFRCLPINTDKWVVLKHARRMLGPANISVPADSYTVNLDWYIKINRQLQFQANPEVPDPVNPIYIVWWGDQVFEDPGAAGQANAFRYGIRSIVYFRDPE